ncbi:MAG: hypothetical protein U9N81_13685 [Bacillota bacterium]|nr:hypothetical protein [Bacillota bacterium]
MLNSITLTHEEQLIANRVNHYFKCPEMSMKDKLYHAILIAQHDLDSHSFCGEAEKNRLTHYKNLLDNIWQKMSV